jgi:hypothetical protein
MKKQNYIVVLLSLVLLTIVAGPYNPSKLLKSKLDSIVDLELESVANEFVLLSMPDDNILVGMFLPLAKSTFINEGKKSINEAVEAHLKSNNYFEDIVELYEFNSSNNFVHTTLYQRLDLIRESKKEEKIAKEKLIEERKHWVYLSSTDKMTDSPINLAVVHSQNQIDDKDASLVFRCKDKKLELFISTDEILHKEYRDDTAPGMEKFDSGAPQKIDHVWGVGTDSKTIFADSRIVFSYLDMLSIHNSYVIQFYKYDQTPLTYEFDLSNFNHEHHQQFKECEK